LISDVLQYGSRIRVADTAVEFSRAPEISVCVPISKQGLSSQDFIGGSSFQEMKGLRNAHGWWELYNCVDVIWHDAEFNHPYIVSGGNFVEDVFTKLFILLAPKHVVSVLRAPLKVVEILAYAMATANKFHNLAPEQVFQSTHRKAGAPAQEEIIF
jgi:hypothetical protein